MSELNNKETEQPEQPSTGKQATSPSKIVAPKKSASKRAGSKKTAANKTTTKKKSEPVNGRTRIVRAYPVGPFEEAFEFSKSIYEYGSGQKVRRLAIFNELSKSPDSSASRMMITNGSKYGLIKGSYSSEFLELTGDGLLANQDEASEYERHRVKLKLAIERIEIFNFLYNRFVGNKLPNQAVIADIIKEESKEIELAK